MKFKCKFTAFFMAVQLLGFSQTVAKNQSQKEVIPAKRAQGFISKSITKRHNLSKRGYSQ